MNRLYIPHELSCLLHGGGMLVQSVAVQTLDDRCSKPWRHFLDDFCTSEEGVRSCYSKAASGNRKGTRFVHNLKTKNPSDTSSLRCCSHPIRPNVCVCFLRSDLKVRQVLLQDPLLEIKGAFSERIVRLGIVSTVARNRDFQRDSDCPSVCGRNTSHSC